MTPREEVQLAREKSVKFWQAVRRRAPKAACYQLMGNHDVRPFKKLMKLAPELEDFFSHQGLFDFKGVTTIQDIREELILNINGQRVMCLHGFYTRRGQHLNANRISTVFAHTHIPWLHHTPLLGSPVLFELNCGFLGDRSTLPMSYTNQRKVSKWMHAFGVVDLRGPRYEIIQTN